MSFTVHFRYKALWLTAQWELIIALLCVSVLPQLLLWITLHRICLMAWWNQSTCCEPPEQWMRWISLFSWFTFNSFPWKPFIMQNYSFHKGTDLDIYKEALFSRSRTGLRGFKYCWQRQEWKEGGGGGERGGEEGGSQCPNPWMKSKLHTKLLWLALWN